MREGSLRSLGGGALLVRTGEGYAPGPLLRNQLLIPGVLGVLKTAL